MTFKTTPFPAPATTFRQLDPHLGSHGTSNFGDLKAFGCFLIRHFLGRKKKGIPDGSRTSGDVGKKWILFFPFFEWVIFSGCRTSGGSTQVLQNPSTFSKGIWSTFKNPKKTQGGRKISLWVVNLPPRNVPTPPEIRVY